MYQLGDSQTSRFAPKTKTTQADRDLVRQQQAQALKIAQLQRALRSAAAKDDRGHLPSVNGHMDSVTVEALNNLMHNRRSAFQGASPSEILVNMDRLISEISKNAIGATEHSATPTAGTRMHNDHPSAYTVRVGKATIEERHVAPKGSAIVGHYTCTGGICVGNSVDARAKSLILQRLLNMFPPSITGQPLIADGKIGNNAAAAFNAVLAHAAARQNQSPPTPVPPENIVRDIEAYIDALNEELPFARQTGGSPTSPLLYTAQANGNITGDPQWRCYVMNLQAQLNRFGHRISFDGVIGKHTSAAVQSALGGSWNPLAVAKAMPKLIVMVKQLADRKKKPPVLASTISLINAKCGLEVTQPVEDKKHQGAVDRVGQPPVVIQQNAMIPLEKVRLLQSLLNTMPLEAVGGLRLQTSGMLDDQTVNAWRAVNQYVAHVNGRGDLGNEIASIDASGMVREIDTVLAQAKQWTAQFVQARAPQRRGSGAPAPRHTRSAPMPQPQVYHLPPEVTVPEAPSFPQGPEDNYPPEGPGSGPDYPQTAPEPPRGKKTPWALIFSGLAAAATVVGVGAAVLSKQHSHSM
jgi:hypothetical protein